VRHELRGLIASTGFTSGHRVVVGHWSSSPVGPMTDVMWARPDGERVLLAPSPASAALIGAVYRFDRVDVVPVAADGDERRLRVAAGDLAVEFRAGPGWPIPFPRPPWFTRLVEGPVARLAMGVRTYGVTPTGVREWYRADVYRPLVAATGTLAGADLGAMAPLRPPTGFGFSEPPRRPSVVAVRPLLEDRTGRLDEVVEAVETG
jgi:hypothetical protein